MTRTWSPFQTAIFDNLASGVGHTVVRARAGSGKTTTILHGLSHIPRDKKVLLCAFGKSIQLELQARAPSHVEVLTAHSLGLRSVTAAWGRVQVDGRFGYTFLDQFGLRGFPSETRAAVHKLVEFAKNTLAPVNEQNMLGMVAEFGIDLGNVTIAQTTDIVTKVLEASAKRRAMIDFNDMVWLPVANAFSVPKYDMVLVDEAQDFNKVQLVLAQMACAPGGRIIMIGDDKQAIYQFRGADAEALPRIIRELDATVLPLSVTYRCPRSIVALANKVVPDLQAATDAIDGQIKSATNCELAEPGDFVLSRKNAPLVKLAFQFLRAGRRADIRGRDLGAMVQTLIRKSGAKDLGSLGAWLTKYQAAETRKLMLADREDQIDAVVDRVETVFALMDGAESIPELVERCGKLFSDDLGPKIMLSTVHRAKGLEANKVWLLVDTFNIKARSERRRIEEENIWYVAVTRSKGTLMMVSKEGS